jgi:hypothetical protein
MTDKSKYASHGTIIKRMPENCLDRWNKPKLGTFILLLSYHQSNLQ